MQTPKDNTLLKTAKALRRDMTPHECKLWYLFLRNYQVKIYKQRFIAPFIVDFSCACAKLVIEIDGSQHYDNSGITCDAAHSDYLESLGLKVIRFPTEKLTGTSQRYVSR